MGFTYSIFALQYEKMVGKNSLQYELYGSAKAGQNGYWRWAISNQRKTLQVGSFYGSLTEATIHAEAAVLRLKQRIQVQKQFHRKQAITNYLHVATASVVTMIKGVKRNSR